MPRAAGRRAEYAPVVYVEPLALRKAALGFDVLSDPVRRAVLERRIREVTVERDLQRLERAMETYREKTGAAPENLPDLVREGILGGIPPEPNGGSYVLDRGGMVRSDRGAQRLQVFQRR